ncbi:MAG: polymorphic toxin type 50 domain-containing protein, partial [Cellvibrio sp.]|uniref:polymorphic toxin type 50 domain-containing protein n=1 Tax=Cellvibrio sp. TaxID=1965322 RepID=UPI00271C7291|nr:polymorphic toxin type 50 domain-containing protein [Cellvibrio sp.]
KSGDIHLETAKTIGSAFVGSIANIPTDLVNGAAGWLERFSHSESGSLGRVGNLWDYRNPVAQDAAGDLRAVEGGLLMLTPLKGTAGSTVLKEVHPALADTAKTIHIGAQGKHVPGHNNFVQGKSALSSNVDAQALLNGVHSGQHSVVGTGARGQPIVNFGRTIGVDASSGLSTPYGTIHTSKHGAHIVPTNPTTIGNN